MRRRALVGTMAMLGFAALAGLFVALSFLFSSPIPAYAQGTNSEPTFTEGETADRSVDENSGAGVNVGAAVSATDPDTGDTLTYSLGGTDAASFEIDGSTGQLITKSGVTYDLETKTSYSVTVTAADPDNAADSIAVTVNLTDVNDAPVFTEGESATRSLAENSGANVNVGAAVSATDQDGDTLTYTLGGTDAGSFEIVESSGQLTTKQGVSYDLEAKASYLVTMTATDPDSATDAIAVTVNLTDANDAPVFSEGENATRSVPENSGADVNVGAPLTATDQDNDTLTYTLGGTDADSFEIVESSGQLTTKQGVSYDLETKAPYSVTVTATDPDSSADAIAVTINLTDVNEAPVFTEGDSTTRSLAENSGANVNVGAAVSATDPDTGDTLAYSLGGTDAASFAINASSGQLKTKAALDYETKPTYTVEVTARDASNLSDTITVTVNVTNVNEDPTFGEGAAATRSVSENTATNTNIGDPITATDLDAGDTLTYSLGGTDAASFAINASSGQLKTKAALDYETKPTYEVAVQVSNGKNVQGTADLGVDDSIAVTITVANVNESPAFPVETSSRSVPENTATNTNIGTPVAATDPDTGDTLTYSLGGTDAASFAINASSGQLKTKAALDYETKSAYEVTVFVRDSKDQDDRVNSVKDDTIDIDINVTNVEEPGRIVLSSRQPQVGTPLVAALTDPDGNITGTTWTWEYSLDKTHWALIASATLASYTPVDATGGNYLRVTASYNDGHGSGKTAQAVPDNPVRNAPPTNDPPAFAPENATRSVDENTSAGQDIGTPVAATDTANDSNMLTYSLEGTDAAAFDINRATGQLLTKASLDHEAKVRYTVTVKVVDPSATSDTIAVTINVTNVDEPPEVSGSDVVDHPENGTNVVAAYTATDPEGGSITWSLEGADKDRFEISSAGELTFKSPPDHDAPADANSDNVYLVTVNAADGAGSGLLSVEVTVSNVNEAPAFPASETGARSVAENTAADENIGVPVAATDPDAGDALTYTLGGADAASFAIDETTGQLKTKAGLDYETKSSYPVTVSVTDDENAQGGADSTADDTIAVTITVTNVNELLAIQGPSTVGYAEDGAGPVAAYTAAGAGNGPITWSLLGDDRADFSISNTGGLTFNTSPDRENPADADTNNVYLVTVQASDGTNTVTKDVRVTVTSQADPPPAPAAPTVQAAAADGHTALSVSWEAPAAAGLSPITGYDVEYRKQGATGWSSANVTVTGTTAAITGVLPDTDYEARVQAKNADGAGAWSEPGTGRTAVTPLDQQVDLTVSYQAAGYTVNEGATGAVSVTLSPAADRVMQIPITVALLTAESGDYRVTGLTSSALAFVPGDSSKSFTFEALQDTDTSDETVTLELGQLPDKVTAGNRPTSVVTIDDDDPVSTPRRRPGRGGGGGGGGGNFGSSSPTNKAPVFTEGTSASRSVAENTAAGVNIGTPVTATDADKDTLTYTVGGDDGSAFAVNRATGQLKTKSTLDFETKSTYRVTMGVFDPNGGSGTITVTITVTNVADVSLVSGTTQMIGVVDSEQDTTVSTLDGGVAVTFPSGSRSGDYQVRLDHGLNNCNANFSGEELWFCLTVDIFDNEGNLEQGVVLSQPSTIKIRRNGDERGGVDAVLGLHAQGGVSAYTLGRTGGEWTESTFTLESDGVGGLVITITGVSSFGLYAGTTDSSAPVQVSHQVATVTVPTPMPQNTGGQGSSTEPTPTPTPTPTPQPTPPSDQSNMPDPTPTPEPVVTPGTNPTPEPTLGHQVSAPFGPLGGQAATPTPAPTPSGIAKAFGNLRSAPPPVDDVDDSAPTAEPEVKGASFDSEGGKSGGMPSWYIAIIMMALAATIAGGSTYFVKRGSRLPFPITVKRSREFHRWWSGW